MSRSMALQVGVGWILRIGVMVSLALESAGMAVNYLQTGDSTLSAVPGSPWQVRSGDFFGFASSTFASVSSRVTAIDLTALGIVVLLLTPYARIAAAVVYYAVERDWKYVAITLAVLSVVTCGLALL